MKHRALHSFFVLTTALLLQPTLTFASASHQEDDTEKKPVPRTLSNVERAAALERFSSLKQSSGFTAAGYVKRTSSTSEMADSSNTMTSPGRVRFQTPQANTQSSALGAPSSSNAITDTEVSSLADQLASTTLGDSVGRQRSNSTPNKPSKNTTHRRAQTTVKTDSMQMEASALSDGETLAQSSSSIGTPSPKVRRRKASTGSTEAPAQKAPSSTLSKEESSSSATPSTSGRKRSVKRSLSTNDSSKKAIRKSSIDSSSTQAAYVPEIEASSSAAPSAAPSSLKISRITKPLSLSQTGKRSTSLSVRFNPESLALQDDTPLSPRILVAGQEPEARMFLAALQQSMFFVPEKQQYVKALFQLNDESTNPIIQGVINNLKQGKVGYKYRIDFDQPSTEQKAVGLKEKETTYPIRIRLGATPLFTADCYLTKEGPTHNLAETIEAALRLPKNPQLFTMQKNSKLLITDYVDGITEEKRTIFTSFASSYLKNLKDFEVIGVQNITDSVVYNIDSDRTVSCVATPQRAGYHYFIMSKSKGYLGTVHVSAFPAEFKKVTAASPSATASSSAPQD